MGRTRRVSLALLSAGLFVPTRSAAQTDVGPPVITVTGVSDGRVLTSSPVTVCYTATDPNLLTDAGELDLIPFRGCTDVVAAGAHALVVTASDIYGNTASVTMSFFVDLAAPTLAVLSPASNVRVGTTSVEVLASATDDARISAVSANGVALASEPGSRYRGIVPLPAEAANAIQVVASDVAARTTSVSITVIRDTTAPTLAVSSPAENGIVASPFDVSGTVSDAALGSLTVDGVVTTVSAGAFTRSVTSALGPRSISVTATDAVGNAATVIRHVTVSPPGAYYCYDLGGNVRKRLDCPFGRDCSTSCP